MKRKIRVLIVVICLGLCPAGQVLVSRADSPEGLSLEELVSGLRQIASSQGREAPPLMRAAYEQWLDGRDRAALDGVLRGAVPALLDELAELAKRMRVRAPADSTLAGDLLDAIGVQAAAQLAASDQGTTDYQEFAALYELGKEHLTRGQRQAALERLSDPDEVGKWPRRQLRKMISDMRRAGVATSTMDSVLTTWLESSPESPGSAGLDVSEMPTGDLWWLCRLLVHYRAGPGAPDFSVRWTGFVEAPVSGTYRFSIFPVSFGYEYGKDYTRQTTAVWIDGRQVLDSTEGGWCFEGTPVSLEAGRKTAIRVDYSIEKSPGRTTWVWSPAVARLYWEGPGVAKSVVPGRALSPPSGSGSGLRAEYRLKVEGDPEGEQTVTVVDPAIDHVWERHRVVPLHPELASELLDELWSRITNPTDLDDYAALMTSGGGGRKPPLQNVGLTMTVWLLELSRRAELANELLARPAILLELETIPHVLNLFVAFYVAVPEQAVDLLGAWAHLRPDAVPRFSVDFYKTNRSGYRELMFMLLQGHRPYFELLEERYLELPDGGCCLPVAYILSIGYATEGRMEEWIEKLEERLADSSLTGDRLVNWLLARARAEEIRHVARRVVAGDREFRPLERLLAGRGWLETACVVAASEPVRLRAYGELITRLAADEQLSAAREMLAAAARRCTSNASAATLARWQQEIDDLESQFRKQHEQRAALAERAYVQRLRQRYQRAVEAGDEAALTRYGQMLAEAGTE